MVCLSMGLCVPMCISNEGGIGVHDIHYGSKSYKLKLLGKLIVHQINNFWEPNSSWSLIREMSRRPLK